MSLLEDVFTNSLNALGTYIGLPNLGTYTNDVIDLIEGEDPNEKADPNAEVLKKLDELQKTLKGVSQKLSDLKAQIGDFELHFQANEVATYTINIQNSFNEINFLLQTPITDRSTMNAIRRRMVTVASQLIDSRTGVLNDIAHIQRFLFDKETGLLDLQNKHLIENNEFFSYYIGLKSVVIEAYRYVWMAEFCMRWAAALSRKGVLDFPESAAWLEVITSITPRLEAYFKETVPESIHQLMGAIRTKGGAIPEISIQIQSKAHPTRYDEGNTFDKHPAYLFFQHVKDIGIVGKFQGLKSDGTTILNLRPLEAIDNPVPGKQYLFLLGSLQQGGYQYLRLATWNNYKKKSKGFGQYPSNIVLGTMYKDEADGLDGAWYLRLNAEGEFFFQYDDTSPVNEPFMNYGLGAENEGLFKRDGVYQDIYTLLYPAKSFSKEDPQQAMLITTATPPTSS